MNILRNVTNKLWSAGSSSELATLDGKLYLVRPTAEVRSGRECVYLDAVCSIRKVENHPFTHELVVTKAYASDEEDLLEDDPDALTSGDELTFLIGAELAFERQPLPQEDADEGTEALYWDASDGDSARYQFVVANGNTEAFELHYCRALYERHFQRDADQATPQQMAAIKAHTHGLEESLPAKQATPRKREPKIMSATPGPASAAAEDPDEAQSDSDEDQAIQDALVTSSVLDKMAGLKVSSDAEAAAAPKASTSSLGANEQTEPASQEDDEIDVTLIGQIAPLPTGAHMVLQEKTDLYLHDISTSTFIRQSTQATVTVWDVPDNEFTTWFTVFGPYGDTDGDVLWISSPLKTDMTFYFREAQNSMVFTLYQPAHETNYTWCLRCTKDVFVSLNETFSKAIFETNNGIGSFKKLTPADQRYNQESYVRTADMDLDEVEEEPSDEEYESATQSQDTPDDEQAEDESEPEESEDEDEDESQTFGQGKFNTKNSQLAVGHKEDLTFVVRGDMIGVFREQRSGGKKLQFTTSIQGLTTPDGTRSINPKQVMLHHQDSKMLLRDPLNPKVAYTLDLERGAVTDTMELNGRDIVNFLPESKFAQLTPEQTFIGHSHNAIYRVDPRLSSRDKVVESQCKTYAGKLNFVSAATTETGEIATLTDKGELRLYDALGKNAKTALPAIGSGAFFTDVTKDGRWIVITQKDHLLVVDATIKDGRYTGESGFHRSFPADKKARPMRLELKPEHKAYMKSDMHFTQARFNTGPDQTESHIVTSSGPYIISWNFRHVKSGKLDSYTIRRYDEAVVADNFKFNDKKDIIVTLGNNVLMENRSNLAKPTRESLGGEAIVKHWSKR